MNKGELRVLVGEYLKRTDFTAVFDNWVRFTSVRIGRALRGQDNLEVEVIAALANPQPLSLQFRQMRSVESQQLNSTYRLQAVDGAANLLALTGSFPVAYRIEGFSLQVRPFQALPVTLAYWKEPDALPDDSSTNAVLEAQPMLYLYGCLVEAAIWAQDPGSASGYLSVFDNEVATLNVQGSEANGGDTPVMGVG